MKYCTGGSSIIVKDSVRHKPNLLACSNTIHFPHNKATQHMSEQIITNNPQNYSKF